MTARITRRNFLKSTATLSALSILPPLQAQPPLRDGDLFAIDFVWRCYDPFFENELEFWLGGGDSVVGGLSVFDDHFDEDQIRACIENKTFRHVCKKSFLVRGFLRSGKSGIPSQNQEIACEDLRSKNPLSSFYCPSCGTGWWLGHIAESFEETFYFVEGDVFGTTESPQVTKVTVPPPAGTVIVRDGQDEWFRKGPPSPPGYPDDNLLFKDEHAWERAYDNWNERCARLERDHLNRWAKTNRFLPNRAYFGFQKEAAL